MTDKDTTDMRNHLADLMDRLMQEHLIDPALKTLERRRKARERRAAKKAAA